MSARTIALPRAATVSPKASPSLERRQVRLTSSRLGTVVLPWWPDEIAWGSMAATYEEQERPGRLPLLLRSGVGLEELRIGTVVRPRDLEGSGTGAATSPTVASILDTLRGMSRAIMPITVSIAGRSSSYRMTDLGITEIEWDSAGNPLAAEISITLKAASEAVVPVGPVKGKGKGRGR